LNGKRLYGELSAYLTIENWLPGSIVLFESFIYGGVIRFIDSCLLLPRRRAVDFTQPLPRFQANLPWQQSIVIHNTHGMHQLKLRKA
jgi:hypothetical protein